MITEPKINPIDLIFGAQQPEHTGPVFVLVVTHSDLSEVRHVWGPFTTEEAAIQAWDQLVEIGIEGRGLVRPLRQAVPSGATRIRVTREAS